MCVIMCGYLQSMWSSSGVPSNNMNNNGVMGLLHCCHSGLSYLAIRHVQMGLERHTDVLRHLKILANMVPSNFNFQFRAGVWCLDPMLAEPSEAVDFLRSAIYGEASSDTSADTEALMEARKHFALALGLTGDFMGAQKELLLILKHFPLDFGAAFYLRDTVNQVSIAIHDHFHINSTPFVLPN